MKTRPSSGTDHLSIFLQAIRDESARIAATPASHAPGEGPVDDLLDPLTERTLRRIGALPPEDPSPACSTAPAETSRAGTSE